MVQRSVSFNYASSRRKKEKGWKRLIILVILLILIAFLWMKLSPSDINLDGVKVSVVKGNTISKFYEVLDKNQTFWMKMYVKRHPSELPNILEWTYVFSGTYSQKEFLEHIAKWPEKEYITYTILEWWSIYDIDADLTAKWYINQWEYISYVTNPAKISELSERYEFFDSSLTSLEGFLYPDTYYVDGKMDFIKQLVSIQLNTFNSRVWSDYKAGFDSVRNNYGFSVYEVITLASIVEKEEKNDDNKPTVAWIFYNRLSNWILLWADITLCYGLAQPYSECTPSVIVKHLNDTNNRYNTRALAWLTPTPIGNPSVSTIEAVLYPNQTSYLFYLHGADGQIHYAETNAQHEQNKQYL